MCIFLCHGATEWVWGRFCAATVFEIIFSENHGTSHPSDGQSNSVHAFEAELKIEGYANQHYKDRISLSRYISIHKWQIGMLSTEKSHIVLCKNCLILLLPVDWLYLWVCHSRQIVVLQVWCNIATWDSLTFKLMIEIWFLVVDKIYSDVHLWPKVTAYSSDELTDGRPYHSRHSPTEVSQFSVCYRHTTWTHAKYQVDLNKWT